MSSVEGAAFSLVCFSLLVLLRPYDEHSCIKELAKTSVGLVTEICCLVQLTSVQPLVFLCFHSFSQRLCPEPAGQIELHHV